MDGDGIEMRAELGSAELAKLPAVGPGAGGSLVRFEYASAANCPGATPGVVGADNLCAEAVAACAGNSPSQGLGPSVRVYRRVAPPAGAAPGQWVQVGTTCFPALVPGGRALDLARVVAAFHRTRFAVPSVRVQPPGGVTLVGLPTFVAVTWPADGAQPGQVVSVDPASLLGYRVQIRPLLQAVTYRFGDGQVDGPTTRLGGSYPDGDVRHTYTAPGRVQVRADVAYTGEFRVGAGAWIPIPGDVQLTGTAATLDVRTATTHLYQSGAVSR